MERIGLVTLNVAALVTETLNTVINLKLLPLINLLFKEDVYLFLLILWHLARGFWKRFVYVVDVIDVRFAPERFCCLIWILLFTNTVDVVL